MRLHVPHEEVSYCLTCSTPSNTVVTLCKWTACASHAAKEMPNKQAKQHTHIYIYIYIYTYFHVVLLFALFLNLIFVSCTNARSCSQSHTSKRISERRRVYLARCDGRTILSTSSLLIWKAPAKANWNARRSRTKRALLLSSLLR